ncbi:enoyl-CoA hydratase-related protein [Sporolactobacillus sp. Y61]|jgi:enoyl-CoA hydratase|uniref:Enoyl-CoA hydratase-related protein n=1 Tax=Sporolactobacillus sp. Y61 TaxID=3160863 RepID=A0AAU8IEC7_9BACL
MKKDELMDNKPVEVSVDGAVGKMTISRPSALNALNSRVIRELAEAFDTFAGRSDIRAVILTGSGEKSFIAGADIGEMSAMNPAEARQFSAAGHQLMAQIEQFEKPVIAAVNGYALGGGCELALACDLRIASRNARFGLPEVSLGIIPGFGGSQRLPRLIGEAPAKELLLTGVPVSAERAYQLGLVSAITDSRQELDHQAAQLARTLVSRSPVAVSRLKQLIRKGMDCDLDTALELEIKTFEALFHTEDRSEGMAAFIEKRQPRFPGK